MQDDSQPYRSTWDCIKSMARNEGYLSFFRGSWLRIIRVAPGMQCTISTIDLFNFFRRAIPQTFRFSLLGGAVQFAVYEQVSAWLDKASASN